MVNATFVYGTNDSNILWQNVRIEELLRARPASFLAQRADNKTVFGRDYEMEGPNKHAHKFLAGAQRATSLGANVWSGL